MINTLEQQPTKEEMVLIESIAELLNYITDPDVELQKMEMEMALSPSNLARVHPKHCLRKAELITNFLKELKGGSGGQIQ